MNNTFLTLPVKYLGAATVGLILAASASADSAKLMWSGNGHYYQRFDSYSVSWAAGKNKCETLGGHLATITSVNEQGFIDANIFNPKGSLYDWYHVGATKVSGQWQWVTGEAWNYTNWYSYDIYSDFLKISTLGVWYFGNDYAHFQGYICEWDYKNFIRSTVIPDINNNGVSELAALYWDTTKNLTTVQIMDPATSKTLSTHTFPASSGSSSDLVVLKNIETSNATPEIGALVYNGSVSSVQIKDVNHNLTIVKNITFLDATYKPKSINVAPDLNGNGSSEIVMLGTSKTTGKSKMEMRDSKTGAVLRSVVF
ncbi:MAG: C-type lectin domain-containing protein [Methyloglobulus sp.]|nr:C-type lectin domain-containing protein [Methyloglobulus sp.]